MGLIIGIVAGSVVYLFGAGAGMRYIESILGEGPNESPGTFFGGMFWPISIPPFLAYRFIGWLMSAERREARAKKRLAGQEQKLLRESEYR